MIERLPTGGDDQGDRRGGRLSPGTNGTPTTMAPFASEVDLKRVPRLRWRLDEGRSVIAVAKRKPYRDDHLYFHGPGLLGVHYQAQTRQGATARVKRYRKMLGGRITKEQPGDFEGLIIFRADSVADIPRIFFKSRSGPVAARPRTEEQPADRCTRSEPQ